MPMYTMSRSTLTKADVDATGAQEFMREHEKAMEHNDKVLEQQEAGGEGEGAEVCAVADLMFRKASSACLQCSAWLGCR